MRQESSLDVTMRAAAALAEQYLRGGDRVSVRVLSPGGEYAGYGTGTTHLRRILTLLARVRPGVPRDVTIDRIDFRAAAGSIVVVLSPMLSEAAGQRDRPARPAGAARDRGRPAPSGDDPRRLGRQRRAHLGAGLADATARPRPPAGEPRRGRLPGGAVERPAHPRGGPPPARAEDPAAPGRCDVIRGIPTSVWVLRLVVVLGSLLALYAAAPEGFVPSPFVGAVVLVLAGRFAVRPEHFVGSVALSVVLVWWALHVGSSVPAGALVAAAGLLAAHVAAVLLGYGPPQMEVGADLVVLWVPRAALVWLAALVVWLTARAYTGHATPTLFWLAGLAAALVGAVVAAVVVPTRDLRVER